MNRYALQQSVFAYLHRANFHSPVPDFDAVPTFIALAEQDINLDVRTRCMIARATQVVDARLVPLPCDYLEAVDMRLTTGQELLYRPRADMGNRLQADAGVTGFPFTLTPSTRYYGMAGDMLELWQYEVPPDPLPAEYEPPVIEMSYFAAQNLGPLDTDTTRVLTALPGLYLWGSLVQSAPFLRNDDRIATWQGLYQSAVFRANGLVERAKSQGSRLVAKYRSAG